MAFFLALFVSVRTDWSSLLGSWRSHTLLPCGEAEASLSARMPVRVLGRRGGARARVFHHGALHAHGLALLSSRALCSFARRSSYLMYSPGCLCGLLGSSGPFCCGGSSHLWPALAVLCVQEVLLSHVLLGLAACQCRLPIFVFAQVTVCRIPSLEFLEHSGSASPSRGLYSCMGL